VPCVIDSGGAHPGHTGGRRWHTPLEAQLLVLCAVAHSDMVVPQPSVSGESCDDCSLEDDCGRAIGRDRPAHLKVRSGNRLAAPLSNIANATLLNAGKSLAYPHWIRQRAREYGLAAARGERLAADVEGKPSPQASWRACSSRVSKAGHAHVDDLVSTDRPHQVDTGFARRRCDRGGEGHPRRPHRKAVEIGIVHGASVRVGALESRPLAPNLSWDAQGSTLHGWRPIASMALGVLRCL
jgi:hypothetical protein